MQREAVAGEINQIDIGRAKCNALFEDARAFVDERKDQPIDDLAFADLRDVTPISFRYAAIIACGSTSPV